MNRKVSVLLVISAVAAFSEVRLTENVGVGSRAYSLGNNYVALSNDQSALYWNPAALGFLPVREFQVGLDGFKLQSDASFYGTKTSDDIQRLRLSNIGVVNSFRTQQGGFAIAAAFQNPTAFDDISTFSGTYMENQNTIHVSDYFKTTGGIRLWNAGFGLQVAPQISIGVSGGLATGRESYDQDAYREVDGNIDNDNTFDAKLDARYVGYDLRAGVMYNMPGKVSAGLRIVFPQVLHYTDNYKEYSVDGVKTKDAREEGRLISSYSGAFGMSFTLPFITVSAEGRATLPYDFVFTSEKIPKSSQAHYVKAGGGLGLEIPVVAAPIVVRLGYSYDELDLHQYAVKYYSDGEFYDPDWSDDNIKVDKNRQLITAGLGFVGQTVSFDISYGWQTWGIVSYDQLHQDYSMHRVTASLAMRY